MTVKTSLIFLFLVPATFNSPTFSPFSLQISWAWLFLNIPLAASILSLLVSVTASIVVSPLALPPNPSIVCSAAIAALYKHLLAQGLCCSNSPLLPWNPYNEISTPFYGIIYLGSFQEEKVVPFHFMSQMPLNLRTAEDNVFHELR